MGQRFVVSVMPKDGGREWPACKRRIRRDLEGERLGARLGKRSDEHPGCPRCPEDASWYLFMIGSVAALPGRRLI